MMFHTETRQCLEDTLRLCRPLLLLATAVPCSLFVSATLAEEVVYNNMRVPHRGQLFYPPDDQTNVLAQPFQLGDHEAISKVELAVGGRGETVTGTIHLSIWDDDGDGFPGQQVGDLGDFDIAAVTKYADGFPPQRLDMIAFKSMVTGLTPFATYFVRGDWSNVEGRSGPRQSFYNGFLTSTEGTFGSDVLLLDDLGELKPSTELGIGRRYLQMSVTAMKSPVSLPGDFDGNGLLTAADINSLTSAINTPTPRFDLNQDGNVDAEDHRLWVKDLKNAWFGDANLDGEFNSGDLIAVFQAGEYEDQIGLNSTWAEGDWNGDGEFDSGDLVFAFQDGGYELSARAAVAAVPEPSGWILLTLGLIGICRVRRRR